ncbi:MAG TPA: hypothetical protein VMV47_09520 [Bacteroidales bacterium]|nr:hypothetical protein [Bacteroidales bacterium]
MMDEILNNLQKIKDFRVLSRTSVEQYRGISKPAIPKIAKELDVNYIVEGSVQKYGNTFRLRVQLIAANDEKHLWGESYEKEIKETKDIFKIQSQVAQTIAAELKATITPEEKQLIEKSSTGNLTAFDFYQRGNDRLNLFNSKRDSPTLKVAEEMFRKALEYDSTFARAYCGLAYVFLKKHFYDSYFSENYLDSCLILADKALSFDDRLAEGYFIRGTYYVLNGRTEDGIAEVNKSLKYNPNNWESYYGLAHSAYLWNNYYADWIKAIDYLQKAVNLNHGKELPDILSLLGVANGYFAGFPNKAIQYFKEELTLTGDSIKYFNSLAQLEIQYGNTEKAFKIAKDNYLRDSTNLNTISSLGNFYIRDGQYAESLNYYKKYAEGLTAKGEFQTGSMLPIGYAYLQNGYKKEAEYWFNEQKKLSEEAIIKGRLYSSWGYAYFDLASLYAIKGDKERAFENLRLFAKAKVCSKPSIDNLKESPFFDSIRNDPEFKKIIVDLEAKYLAEHERVRKWLEEQGKL